MLKKLIKNSKPFLLIFLFLVALAIWSTYLQEPDSNLHVIALDVGQGDAILVQKENFQLLIDGGPDNSVIEELGKFMPLEDKTIEMMILTHPHADHVSGLVEVLKRYKVKEVSYYNSDFKSNIFEEFKNEISRQNIHVENPSIEKKAVVLPDIELTYLWPNSNFKDENINNESLVFRLKYNKFSAVFAGDCELVCWSELLAKNPQVDSDLLKVSHHGSSNGTTKDVVDRISPTFAVISLGQENKYGFPHKAVVEMLSDANTTIYRTDKNSSVDFSTDGEAIILE